MPPGAKPARGQHLEADAVGLALHVAREVELALDRAGLAAGDRPRCTPSALWLRAAASTPSTSAARPTSDWRLTGRDAARDVALRDVRHLVREHRGELVARRRHRDQAEVDADVAAGQRECVDARIADQERLPGEARSMSAVMLPSERDCGDERLPDRLEVLEQQRVVDVVGVDADLAHDLVAELALGADVEVVFGRCRRARAGCSGR